MTFLAISRFFQRIPWPVWAVLAVILLWWAGMAWHGKQVRETRSEADAAGYSRAMGEVRAQMAEVERKALERIAAAHKQNLEANRKVSEAYAIRTADNRTVADRLRNQAPPGSAACPQPRALPGTTPGTSGTAPSATGGVDAGMAVIPWRPLIDHAEQCDTIRAQLAGWINWYQATRAGQ